MQIGERIVWSNVLEIIGHILLLVLGIYEVIVRIYPTVRDWTILGNIIKVLAKISDWLNNTNKSRIV